MNRHDPQTIRRQALERGEKGDVAGAIELLRHAIRLSPATPELYDNLGHFLRREGRSAEAVDAYRQALRLRPDYAHAHSSLLYAMLFDERFDGPQIRAEHERWAQRQTRGVMPMRGHANDRDPDRKLRVGYVSPNFRNQAVNFFVEPILRHHDRDRFEVFCYADVRQPDVVTARLQSLGHAWRIITGAPDDVIAAQIVRDRVDVLVDLTGHLAQNRMRLFALKPAPVQVTYIGYQATTGLPTVDWRLTDEHADPEGFDAHYVERLYRLPRAFFTYQPHAEAPDVGPLPAASTGFVTFGSFNHTAKLNPAVARAWAEILHRVPGSRLTVLLHDATAGRDYVAGLFAASGVEPGRITFSPRLALADYLRLMERTDVAVDPFPFGGHTTTCDALWCGCPLVTLAGGTFAGRMSTSVLRNIGLDDLVAADVPGYVDAAARLASDLPRLASLRAGLLGRMGAVIDARRFTAELEDAYRFIWREWLRR